MKSKAPQAKHERYLNGLKAVMKKHLADVPADEMMAVTAQFLGQLIACQDTRLDPSDIMATVNRNILLGNQAMITTLAANADKVLN